MFRIERSMLVPYSPEQMFGLVTEINDYPLFLPGCTAARARQRSDGKVDVTIEIDFHGVRASFTTRNENLAFEEIKMELVEGPFRRLEGGWNFRPLGSAGCSVRLDLRYEFAGGLLGRAVAPAFDRLAGSLVDAFNRRAEVVFDDVR